MLCSLCSTAKQISHNYTYIYVCDIALPSWVYPLPHPTPLGHHRAPGWAPCDMQQLPPVIYLTHDSVCMSMLLSQLSYPLLSLLCSQAMHSWSGYSDLCPLLPDPMHTLGILPVTGRHTGSLWVKVLPDLSHPGTTLSCPGLPSSLSFDSAKVSFFPSQLPIFKLFQPKLGQSILCHPNLRFSRNFRYFSLMVSWSLHFHKQVLKEGI